MKKLLLTLGTVAAVAAPVASVVACGTTEETTIKSLTAKLGAQLQTRTDASKGATAETKDEDIIAAINGLKFIKKEENAKGYVRYYFSGDISKLKDLTTDIDPTDADGFQSNGDSYDQIQDATAFISIYTDAEAADATTWAAAVTAGVTPKQMASLGVIIKENNTTNVKAVASWIK